MKKSNSSFECDICFQYQDEGRYVEVVSLSEEPDLLLCIDCREIYWSQLRTIRIREKIFNNK